MRMPRVRFTLRTTMVIVALVAVLLTVGIPLLEQQQLIEIVSVRYVDNEPLASRTRVIAIDGLTFVLEDGRLIVFDEESRQFDDLLLDVWDPQGFFVELEAGDSGSVRVYTKQPAVWFCGNTWARKPLIRIPIATQTILLNKKELLGTARIVACNADSPKSRQPSPAP
jgi:hypothetical protein